MKLALLLPWFPIVLAAGVAGRLLGRGRGFAFGLLCALFWVVLVQATTGVIVWHDAWAVTALLTGGVAICLLGGWSGLPACSRDESAMQRAVDKNVSRAEPDEDAETLFKRFGAAMDRFDDWLSRHREAGEPWAEFGELLRTILFDCCKATHVKPYRLVNGQTELEPLRARNPFTGGEPVPARRGIVGHVLSTGRSFVAGDQRQGELVDALATEGEEPIVWCFAVKRDGRRLGVVTVGKLDMSPERRRAALRAVEGIVGQFWATFEEAIASDAARSTDPVSGLLARGAFLSHAERVLRGSYDSGEPVAVAVIAVQGLRGLTDAGKWEVADEAVGAVARLLRRKVRLDDCLARFDGSRFVWLLRRVDSQLAGLIVKQLITQLADLVTATGGHEDRLGVCCGVTGTGQNKPTLRTLVSRALVEAERARVEGVPVASDLEPGEGKPADSAPIGSWA